MQRHDAVGGSSISCTGTQGRNPDSAFSAAAAALAYTTTRVRTSRVAHVFKLKVLVCTYTNLEELYMFNVQSPWQPCPGLLLSKRCLRFACVCP